MNTHRLCSILRIVRMGTFNSSSAWSVTGNMCVFGLVHALQFSRWLRSAWWSFFAFCIFFVMHVDFGLPESSFLHDAVFWCCVGFVHVGLVVDGSYVCMKYLFLFFYGWVAGLATSFLFVGWVLKWLSAFSVWSVIDYAWITMWRGF